MSRQLRVSIVTASVLLACLASGRALTAQDAASATTPSATTPATSNPSPIPEVVVHGRSDELAPRVLSFVDQIAAPEYEEGPSRWASRVCPLVFGLPKAEGEFMLARISLVARTAGIPLAGEQCRPNLYIMVTGNPKSFLKIQDKWHRVGMFGNAGPRRVDEFIHSARPVRVWYNTNLISPDGINIGGGDPVSSHGGPTAHATASHSDASRLKRNVVSSFTTVLVVIDQTQLHNVSRGQLADYVGMVGLAKLKPDLHVVNAPSILALFDGDPKAAPGAMTDWDGAFLKSLYETDPESRLQRSQIAVNMIQEMVP
ncbi:MAG TPA: hypothetical protein VGM84_10895 [Steroidobacteraceae bacterium]|jgi:hypothetical protein